MGQPLLSGDCGESNWVELDTFFARLNFGSSVLSSVQTREIVSIVRNSAGNYTVTLPRIYRQLVELRCSLISSSGAVLFPVVRTDSVATAGTFIFELATETGTATDPASGAKGMLAVVLSNDPFNDATI